MPLGCVTGTSAAASIGSPGDDLPSQGQNRAPLVASFSGHRHELHDLFLLGRSLASGCRPVPCFCLFCDTPGARYTFSFDTHENSILSSRAQSAFASTDAGHLTETTPRIIQPTQPTQPTLNLRLERLILTFSPPASIQSLYANL
ncbi:hypothetical protein LMH87_002413 [Akanthomyces muscarius]|uniref:Uncharacterized protein n=1 Tax=Akanthomyces muscarius TaxID=2231603 RepID=A0A9W8Q688_AKAMU|nr:hypothetical protein LMH87_002413 [Akanthomyces muscarius]KAJ4147917.1 hypothetical protein LMH87_002413 [Akanthomyces muscarius]